jgi:hypothetical protein|tara:strand:- start:193 stop:477 length:285 start_codon:yes stop_codon:yes gene_type:complete
MSIGIAIRPPGGGGGGFMKWARITKVHVCISARHHENVLISGISLLNVIRGCLIGSVIRFVALKTSLPLDPFGKLYCELKLLLINDLGLLLYLN